MHKSDTKSQMKLYVRSPGLTCNEVSKRIGFSLESLISSFFQTKQEEASPDLDPFSGSEDDIATREFDTAVSNKCLVLQFQLSYITSETLGLLQQDGIMWSSRKSNCGRSDFRV